MRFRSSMGLAAIGLVGVTLGCIEPDPTYLGPWRNAGGGGSGTTAGSSRPPDDLEPGTSAGATSSDPSSGAEETASGGPEDGTQIQTGTGTEDTTGTGGSDTTGGGATFDPSCVGPTVFEEFDGGVLGPNWSIWPSSDGTVEASGGRFRMRTPHQPGGGSTGATFGGVPDVSTRTLTVRGLAWDDLSGVRWDIVLRGSSCEPTIRMTNGQLAIVPTSGPTTAVTFDPIAHAWLRLFERDGSLRWGTSPDGSTWTPLADLPGCDLGVTSVDFVLTTSQAAGPVAEASLDAWGSCV